MTWALQVILAVLLVALESAGIACTLFFVAPWLIIRWTKDKELKARVEQYCRDRHHR